MPGTYNAILLVSFGGPEGNSDVIPFLQNVLRGKNVPESRLEQVAHHYYQFGGVSPINAHCRALIQALREELVRHGIDLPIYWGNRNWHPMLEDTMRQMAADGVSNALAFVTSAYSSYSSCRQYLEDIERARRTVGDTAPKIDKLRAFYNHPNFIDVNAEKVGSALQAIAPERRREAHIAFTAHSIPTSMADNCRYAAQLEEAAGLVADKVHCKNWRLVYQSRSGPPTQPWLEPDICDHLRVLAGQGVKDVVLSPVGFISDHMEVIYDLDTEAKKLGDELGINVFRAATAGCDKRFIEMIRLLIEERLKDGPKLCSGEQGPCQDTCPIDCCASGSNALSAGRPAGQTHPN